MAPRRSRHRLLTDRFRLDDRYFYRGNKRRGEPAIIGGEYLDTGERIAIKEWVRDPLVVDDDLRDIWRHEIRQLHRLRGFPRADEYIVPLLDSAEDENSFYLVLGCGQRRPLQTFLDSPRKPQWLDNRRVEEHRLRIWRNLERLAIGLDILHTQGLLHRNLNGWAVFTDSGEEPDFQLSGFEWSVRLTSAGAGVVSAGDRRGAADEPFVADSFSKDWRSFGELASTLFEVDSGALLRNRISCSTARHLLGAEKSLLYDLLRRDPLKHFDGNMVIREIQTVVSILAEVTTRREGKLCLACELGRNSDLSKAIYKESGEKINLGEIERQLEFMQDDLSGAPQLVEIKGSGPNSDGRLLLVGQALNYRLRAFLPQGHTEAKWDLAFCRQVEYQRPHPNAVEQERVLSDTRIEIMSLREGHRRFAALQGQTIRWPEKVRGETVAGHLDPEAERFHRSLILIQILDALFTACNIWPVRLVESSETGGLTRVGVSPRPDKVRDELSKALGMEPPALRISAALVDDQTATESDWKLSEVGSLGTRDYEEANWKFVGYTDEGTPEVVFRFERAGAVPLGRDLYMWHGQYVGHNSLLRRRLKALRTLGEHTELLGMLTNRRICARRSHEHLAVDETFKDLDESKKQVLEEIWGVLPSYFVQGPPGVGKTRLVRELITRYSKEDSTARLLLSAQSHQALDHLLAETKKALDKNEVESWLNVRCRPRDHQGPEGPFDLRRQSQEILNGLLTSRLTQVAPPNLREKLEDLHASFAETGQDRGSARRGSADRAFEALLLRSANVVFASTNSGDLERLIDERAQFDWAIVEEAGKATGVELVSPLLLSHRRLLIGDHKQLPPFQAERMVRLLANPESVKEALKRVQEVVSVPLRQAGMEDMLGELEANDDFVSTCSAATTGLMMFETIVEDELRREGQTALPIARRLTDQHRMHPAICRLVSNVFYGDQLISHSECERRFSEESPPFTIVDEESLPGSPIVFVDMPYVQKRSGQTDIEQLPWFHNPDEVAATVEVLSLLRTGAESHGKASLAVLTPYKEQARRLEERIRSELAVGNLRDLEQFRTRDGKLGTEVSELVGTVDSFQGDEADIVVVSLVRNNHHSGSRALGFLSDARRMNVLLSRARWKLVLIGSLSFLRHRFTQGESVATDDPLAFLKRMLNTIDAMQANSGANAGIEASVVPVDTLMGRAS